MRFFGSAGFEFLEKRKTAYLISGVFLLIGLLSIAGHRGFNYGVDFTGGTLFQIRFSDATRASDLRSALVAAGLTNLQVQNFGEADEFLVRMAEFTEGGDRELAGRVEQLLTDRFGIG